MAWMAACADVGLSKLTKPETENASFSGNSAFLRFLDSQLAKFLVYALRLLLITLKYVLKLPCDLVLR